MKGSIRLLLFFCGLLSFASALSYGQDAPLSPGEHFGPVNGLRLHYYVAGKGPVCLVPSPAYGIPVNYLMPMKPLGKHFTLVYYDTRLSGQSSGPADPMKYTLQDMTDDMDSLRAYLRQPKIWLIGHSGGGYISLNYAVHHNDRLNGMIVIDAIAAFDSLTRAERTRLLLKRNDEPSIAGNMNIVLGKDTTFRTATEIFYINLPFYYHDAAKADKFPRNFVINDSAKKYITLSHLLGKNLLPALHNITVPVLVIAGDDDYVCPPQSEAARIHQYIASSTLCIIKDCGHFSFLEQPTEFYKACDSWLNGLPKQ